VFIVSEQLHMYGHSQPSRKHHLTPISCQMSIEKKPVKFWPDRAVANEKGQIPPFRFTLAGTADNWSILFLQCILHIPVPVACVADRCS
jgi:hypothetical protein